jgi:glycosyltransferase involved in cell wall biosynthesis
LFAVHSFARFAKSNPEAKLYMIYQSAELLDEVMKLLKETEAHDSIILVGRIEHDDLLHWYNAADFIVSSSLYEGSGTAVCEAMSCGCIPIVPSLPSFTMMTENGKCGVLFAPGDSEDLFNVLLKSEGFDLTAESQRVLNQFKEKLSPEAIAKICYEVITSA